MRGRKLLLFFSLFLKGSRWENEINDPVRTGASSKQNHSSDHITENLAVTKCSGKSIPFI